MGTKFSRTDSQKPVFLPHPHPTGGLTQKQCRGKYARHCAETTLDAASPFRKESFGRWPRRPPAQTAAAGRTPEVWTFLPRRHHKSRGLHAS